MPFPPNPEDRPDPLENMPAMRARIPDHIARGEISTGVIVVTGGTEYLLDFVRNLPRPNAIVARVVLPHMVMPQFIEALSTNIELFRQRYGDLPGMPGTVVESHAVPKANPAGNATQPGGLSSIDSMFGQPLNVGAGEPLTADPIAPASATPPAAPTAPGQTPANPNTEPSEGTGIVGGSQPPSAQPQQPAAPSTAAPSPAAASQSGNQIPQSPQPANSNNANGPVRRQNPQEVYDELKLRDEILSGAYANAVMIGHGPYEFSFDFITNFYPQSAVSCRVYLAAGHVWRLLESLKQSWEQLRPRLGNPPPPQQQPPKQPPF